MMSTYRPFTTTARGLSLLIAALAVLSASTAVLAQTMASSVSQRGITWFFDQPHEVGQYANGDWWVMGPVTITNITPESTEVGGVVRNGTMVNPTQGHSISEHGYDSRANQTTYVDALNRSPSRTGTPISISTGSVVSTVSFGDWPAQPTGSYNRPLSQESAVLTVVNEVPPERAFRPHPYGTDKTSYWTEADLDYSVLNSLPFVGTPPSIAQRGQDMLLFFNEQVGGHWHNRQTRRFMEAYTGTVGTFYGTAFGAFLGENLLLLHLSYDNVEKRDLLVGMVQFGIDVYGRVTDAGNTSRYSPDGGHGVGTKGPMVLAAVALNDDGIKAAANGAANNNWFADDCSTFYVTQAEIDRIDPVTGDYYGYHRGNEEDYETADIGMPEWGNRHCTQPQRNSRDWGRSYRYNGGQKRAQALAMLLTTGRIGVAVWNHPAFFDYADRYALVGDAGRGYGTTAFTRAMWAAYRDMDGYSPKVFPPAPPAVLVE